MNIKESALIILIWTMNFAIGIGLNAQDTEAQRLNATSANGFWVQINPSKDYRIEQLHLAKSKVFGVAQTMGFEDVFSNSDLTDLLRTTYVFAVLSEVPKGVKFKRNLLGLDQWVAKFEFDPTQSIENRPLLIIKTARLSLVDLAERKAANFTTSSNLEALQVFIAQIKKKVMDTPSPYSDIVKILEDPNWNGVIGLNIKVDQKSLSPEIQQLTSSKDPLQWDIIGWELSPFNQELAPSSIFGLLDYKASPSTQLTSDPGKPYLLRQFFLWVRNSQLSKARARVEVKPDEVTTFWSKRYAEYGLKLSNQQISKEDIYELDGTVQSINSIWHWVFEGKDGRPGNVLLESLLRTKQKN